LEAGARLPLVKTAPHFSVLPRTGAVVRARVGDLAWPFLLSDQCSKKRGHRRETAAPNKRAASFGGKRDVLTAALLNTLRP
jgi:hypothetical protein